ncbi:5'-nucleotidase, lipoprotein e(P4) family [Fimbriiglobus ruber]|uniref:Acid phosphatase n=1 Tax=Fimbriiglobus ruber TaxID=1908690 RepID=A0A225DZH0_9BACT|nr:HAD family acid phosphatase [Fimbriiglobus ruber]OWK43928.1 Acid phosphatase [Fimbriiglobus ruber]
MPTIRSAVRSLALCATGLVVGVVATAALRSPAQAPPAFKKEVPTYRGLDANLYMETSAEYRACCFQAYALATARVDQWAKDKNTPGRPPAVILDLDETVLDNAGFQVMLIRSGLAYDQRLWDEWEDKYSGNVELVPGAKDFIDKLKGLKIAPFYISNRSEKYRVATKKALARLEIDVPDDQLLLVTTTSDKTARRATAATKFDVFLYLGDNLRDFDEMFKYDAQAGIPGRKAAVDKTRTKFGTDWIIFPNPAYGEWTKPFDKGEGDTSFLVPGAMPAP